MNVPNDVLAYMAWGGICPSCGCYDLDDVAGDENERAVKCRDCGETYHLSHDSLEGEGPLATAIAESRDLKAKRNTISLLCVEIAAHARSLHVCRMALRLSDITVQERVRAAWQGEQSEAILEDFIKRAREQGVFPNWRDR